MCCDAATVGTATSSLMHDRLPVVGEEKIALPLHADKVQFSCCRSNSTAQATQQCMHTTSVKELVFVYEQVRLATETQQQQQQQQQQRCSPAQGAVRMAARLRWGQATRWSWRSRLLQAAQHSRAVSTGKNKIPAISGGHETWKGLMHVPDCCMQHMSRHCGVGCRSAAAQCAVWSQPWSRDT
jgi:hypothetical protein